MNLESVQFKEQQTTLRYLVEPVSHNIKGYIDNIQPTPSSPVPLHSHDSTAIAWSTVVVSSLLANVNVYTSKP